MREASRSVRVAWLGVVAALALAVTASAAAAGTWVRVTPDNRSQAAASDRPEAPVVEVPWYDASGLAVTIDTPGLELEPCAIRGGTFLRVGWPGCGLTGESGSPALPVVRRLCIIPEGAEVELRVRTGPAAVVDLGALGFADPLMPVQPPMSAAPDKQGSGSLHYDAAAYAADGWQPAERVTLIDAGVVRGHHLHLLEIRPAAYDATGGALLVWPHIEVDTRFVGGTTSERALMTPLRGPLLNPPPQRARGARSGNYLIVVADTYATAAPLDQFVAAKTAEGFNVMTHAVSVGTTNTAIKTYIQSLWNTPDAPDYLLLVGDTDRIPHWYGGGDSHAETDLPYACMDGGDDWYPDMAIGRFSVRSLAHLEAQVDKSLTVASGVFPDPDYTRRAAFMAGTDIASGAEGAHDWVIATHLEPNEFQCARLYMDAYGATTQDVLDTLNAGCVYCIYMGHSGTTSMYNGPPIDRGDVASLTNTGMYPIVVAFSCQAARFTREQCIGETFLIGANKAAAAFIGTTTFTYYFEYPWDETIDLEKELFNTIYVDGVREVGPVLQGSLMRLLALYGPTEPVTRDYFEMFVLLGEPSLLIPSPVGFTLSADPESQQVCAPPADEAVYTIDVEAIGNFNEPVTLATTGEPAGASVAFSVNGVVPPFTTTMTIGNLSGCAPDAYDVLVTGVASPLERTVVAGLTLSNDVPGPVTLSSPADGQAYVPVNPTLVWQPADQALEYDVEIATDADFANIVYSATLEDVGHTVETSLATSTPYYWHVRGTNTCGDGAFSPAFTFSTVELLPPIAYDMLNGEAGAYAYYDDTYDGDGDNTVPLAPLSGGLGDLTDGTIATQHWNLTPVPYVGWQTVDPTITFHFDGQVLLGVVRLHLDDMAFGVFPPTEITLTMGESTIVIPVDDPGENVPFALTCAGLGLVGDTLELTLTGAGPDSFVMVSEVGLFGGPFQNSEPGDLDCDGDVDFDDINPFVLALSGQAAYETQYPECNWLNGDCDADGDVDFDDINPFVGLIGT